MSSMENSEILQSHSDLLIGWAQTDITPLWPVTLRGQMYVRISEGVSDPLTATAWALESDQEQAVLVSCDLVSIADDLLQAVRSRLQNGPSGLDPAKVVLFATHTHTSPDLLKGRYAYLRKGGGSGLDLDVAAPDDYLEYVAQRLADVIGQAWSRRARGGIAYGAGVAVIGRNRRWINDKGEGTMYNLKPAVLDTFRHIEGYEDHSVNVIAAYDEHGELTGLVVNLACPSQVSEQEFTISADFWHETRLLLRQQFGEQLFILPQCSTAGDLAPHEIYNQSIQERMLKLKGRTLREEIAGRIVHAVQDILPYIDKDIRQKPLLRHHTQSVALPESPITEADIRYCQQEIAKWQEVYDQEVLKLQQNPELRQQPRWYQPVSNAYGRIEWLGEVIRRYEGQQADAAFPVELHVLRIGEIVIATNPFEYYLDYGIQIKSRSEAQMTLLVQLAGRGTYLPSKRSLEGKGYGSIPASYRVGPEGGQQLVEHTLQAIRHVYSE